MSRGSGWSFDVRYEWQYKSQLRAQGKVLIFSITYLDFQPPLKLKK